MKEFKSKGSYIVESAAQRKEIIFFVENDIDRNNKEIEDKWGDLRPTVKIDGRIFKTRAIRGHTPLFSDPIDLNKGTIIGISTYGEIKNKK